MGPEWMTLADASIGMLESQWYCLVLRPSSSSSSSVLMRAAAISLHSPSTLWDAAWGTHWVMKPAASPDSLPSGRTVWGSRPTGRDGLQAVMKQAFDCVAVEDRETKMHSVSLQELQFPCCLFYIQTEMWKLFLRGLNLEMKLHLERWGLKYCKTNVKMIDRKVISISDYLSRTVMRAILVSAPQMWFIVFD